MKLHGTIPGIRPDGAPFREVRVSSAKGVVAIDVFDQGGTAALVTVTLPHNDARSLMALIETAMRRARGE